MLGRSCLSGPCGLICQIEAHTFPLAHLPGLGDEASTTLQKKLGKGEAHQAFYNQMRTLRSGEEKCFARGYILPSKSGTPTSQPKSGAHELQDPSRGVPGPVLWTLEWPPRPEWPWKAGALYNPQIEDWGTEEQKTHIRFLQEIAFELHFKIDTISHGYWRVEEDFKK